MTKPTLKIDWATHKAALFACEHWHYSGCIPKSKVVKVGVWENDQFIGVVLFSSGASPFLPKRYDLDQDECCELTRIALREHQTPVSRIVRIALSFLKRHCPGMRLVVSFADPEQGHHGGIYQAGNWIYAGQTLPAKWYMIEGKLTHPRSLGNRGLEQSIRGAREWDPDAYVVEVAGKHRYLMPLDAKMREQVIEMSEPYPKRESNNATD